MEIFIFLMKPSVISLFERKEIIIQTLFETYQEKLFVVISHDKKIMNMGYDYVIMEKGKIIEKG